MQLELFYQKHKTEEGFFGNANSDIYINDLDYE